MERGSYRPSNSDRRVINRSEQGGTRASEQPASQPASASYDEPRPATRSQKPAPGRAPEPSKRPYFLIALALGILVLAIVAWFVISSFTRNSTTAIDSSKYQAVLLSNGESYFGKLAPLNDEFMKLTDIYYLKAKSIADNETAQSAEDSFQLIKFGGEVQGPEDEILISKNQIIYYENLRPDGKASKAIEQHKKSQ